MPITKLPGLIDVHTHLREPGATHKEDFYTGTRAAIKGGFTFVADMPNNPIPTITPDRLEDKIRLADQKAICDVGFHYGTNGRNTTTFHLIWDNPRVYGLKIYFNHTTGEMMIENQEQLERIFKDWKSKKPILVHAEGPQLELALQLGKTYKRKMHICHLTQATEVVMVRRAKEQKQDISVGVSSHQLFLTNMDVPKLKGYAVMKPPLGTEDDRQALWEGIQDGTIDLVETDHAPHTKAEKEQSPPVFGVPGLETALGLLCLAVKQKLLKKSDVKRLLYDTPKKRFKIPTQPNTHIEVDFDIPYTVGSDGYETKCGWSPFDGWEVCGKVRKVVLRGKTLYAQNTFL